MNNDSHIVLRSFFTCAAAQKSHVYMIPKMIHDLHSFKQLHFAI